MVREKPDLVQRVVDVVVRATNEIYSNQDDVSVKYFAKQFNLPEEDARKVFLSVRVGFTPVLSDEGLNRTLDMAKKDLNMTDQVPLSKISDLSFLKKALESYPRK